MESKWLAVSLLMIASVALSFFFALAESALFALGRFRARQLAEGHPIAGGLVLKLLEQPDRVLGALVFGNTMANAMLVAIVLGLILVQGQSWLLLGLALFLVILLFCEVAPKTLAVRAPEYWALRIAKPAGWFLSAINPVLNLTQKLTDGMVRLIIPKSVKPQPALTDDEYAELIEMAFQQGALGSSEKQIILQILSLDRKTAADAMRPRSTIFVVSDEVSHKEMIEAARESRHSRVPIYDETPDTIVGILNTRILLTNPESDIADAIELPSFVPASMNLLQLLNSLQRQRRGMAVVLDEFGGTAGIVSMEDILETVLGRVRVRGHDAGFIFERIKDGSWRVSGQMRLEDFRREYPELPDVDDVDTMGGLMTRLAEVVPKIGDQVLFGRLCLTATRVDERRVFEMLVEKT